MLDLRIGARVRVSIIEERESFRERERPEKRSCFVFWFVDNKESAIFCINVWGPACEELSNVILMLCHVSILLGPLSLRQLFHFEDHC